tara:strand:- start:12 stop:1643 length:1632 start_codon:yes stop_codon:yes gene_type:complete
MTIDPQEIGKRLREQRETTKTETSSLNEQLALTDVKIDEYDELINKIDRKIPPLIDPINQKIRLVQQAYLDRISHGCRSDLTWTQVETREYRYYNRNNRPSVTYEVTKDPNTFRFLGFYGPKFYKFPKNMDYSANVVETIDKADANVGSNALILLDDDAETLAGFTTGRLSGIKTGDFITDSLDSPTVFLAGAGTSVTGFGLTDYAAYNYPVSGFCTTGDNKLYADQKIGFITSFSIGDEVYASPDKAGLGIVAAGTTITGFGTAVGITSIFDNETGITTAVEVVYDFATLSNVVTNSIDPQIGTSFYVGVVSAYYFAELSAQPSAPGINSSFIVVRPGNLEDIEFESSKNPVDPVEIGIARGANIGKGHKLELTNNGDPDIIAKWREILDQPEPLVGAGRVEYYVGTTQWPTISIRGADGDVTTTHASLGQRLVISGIGSITAAIGYTGNPPGGNIPNDCGTYDQAIVDAEDEMNNIIQQNVPRINHYINGADSLRSLRNDDETTAWGYLQAIGYNNAKASKQIKQAEAVEDFDWDDILNSN